MLSLSLFTLGLATIGAYAKPTIRVPGGLEVSLSTPADTVRSASEIRIVAAVKNVGDEDLTIRKSGTVLDNQETTQSFIVTKDGQDVPFTGFKVLFSTDYPPENDLVAVIPAGKTVAVEHDVSAVYDFSAAGPGTFTFDPIPRIRVIGTNNTIETSTARSVSITVIDVSKHELLDREIHEPVIDCNGDKKKEKILRDAYWGARDMANVAILNIQHHDRDDPLYKQAFGSNNPVDVVANFITLVSPDGPHRLGCYESDKNGFYEYDGQDKKIIWFYDRFFDLPKDNYLCVKTDLSQPRITLGGTMMVALGPTQGFHADENKMGCVALGKSLDPEKFTSAANYACYAAMTYGYYTYCGKCNLSGC